MADPHAADETVAAESVSDATEVVPGASPTEAAQLAWSAADDPPPPPGWYADPENAGCTRYWDGMAWAAPARKRMNDSTRWAIAAGVIVLALIVGAILSATSGHDNKRPAANVGSSSQPPPATTPWHYAAITKDGTYRIDDCFGCTTRPGVYETAGAVSTDRHCQWQRLDDNEVLESGSAGVSEPVVLRVQLGEFIRTVGCQPWRWMGR